MTEWFDLVPMTPLEVPVSILGCWLLGGLCNPVINRQDAVKGILFRKRVPE